GESALPPRTAWSPRSSGPSASARTPRHRTDLLAIRIRVPSARRRRSARLARRLGRCTAASGASSPEVAVSTACTGATSLRPLGGSSVGHHEVDGPVQELVGLVVVTVDLPPQPDPV